MNQPKIIYWIATGIMCLIFTFSALLYFFNTEAMRAAFDSLGFPTWLLYPMATAKLLGVIAILSRKSDLLKEWAYAGFFFDAALAFTAHNMAQDGQWALAAIAIAATLVSRYFEPKVFVKG